MKRVHTLEALLTLVFLVGSCRSRTQNFLTIATGGTAGTYYPLGLAMTEIWNKRIPGMNATALSTNASVANVMLLQDGKADVVMIQNDIAWYAFNGLEMFKSNAYPEIRGLCTLYPETCQIVTLDDRGIKTIADLKGKRVAVGASGSGVEINARQILDAAGLSYADVAVRYLSFAEAAANLKNGSIDAAFLTSGYPTAAVTDIATSRHIRLLELDDAIITKLFALYPFYTRETVPAGVYEGMDTDIKTVSVKAMLAVASRMDSALAEKMLATLFGNTEKLATAHRSGAFITVKSAQNGMPIPLHPGAARFWKGIR